MQTRIVCILIIFVLLAFWRTGHAEKQQWEKWTESQHPPVDSKLLPIWCKAVKYRGQRVPISESIKGSGKHCVVHDFVQRKSRDLISGRQRGSPINDAGTGNILTFFESSNVDLDLQNHLVSGSPFEDTRGIGTKGIELCFLKVHNGKIETPGRLGISIEMASGDSNIRKRIEMMKEDISIIIKTNWNGENQSFNEIPWDYSPPTFYTAENLQIKSGGRAIIMAGSDNVVRNNTIEVDGRTAVYLYGPRSLVEGNTFIVHMDPRDKAPLPAILKLRDADGSIIRNNRFIVKRSGLFRKKEEEPQAGINLLESKDVVIEGNVFEEITLLVRKDAASTTTESGNISKGSP